MTNYHVSSVTRRRIIEDMERLSRLTGKTLPELVKERIDSVYGGNQREFARKTGLSPQTVYALVHGKVSLPQAHNRRILSQELGISHLHFLLLAEELGEDEIPKEGDPIKPFPDGDPRYAILELLPKLADGDVETIRFMTKHLVERRDQD